MLCISSCGSLNTVVISHLGSGFVAAPGGLENLGTQ
jgi:hypothetical protein